MDKADGIGIGGPDPGLLPTAVGYIGFLLKIEQPDGSFAQALTGNVVALVEKYNETIDAMKTAGLNNMVQLCVVIFPFAEDLDEETREKVKKGVGVVPGAAYTLQSWVGDDSLDGIEEFLRKQRKKD